MRSPWVTRGTYDELMRLTERLQDDLRVAHQCLAESQRHAVALMQAFKAPPPPPRTTPVPQQLPQSLPVAQKDEVAEAIELAAQDNQALARHLARWSKQQKMNGADETYIINSILHWQTGELPYE